MKSMFHETTVWAGVAWPCAQPIDVAWAVLVARAYTAPG